MIRNDTVYLKSICKKDTYELERAYRHLNSEDNKMLQFMTLPLTYDEYVENTDKSNVFAVYNIPGVYVGNISITNLDTLNRTAKISIFIWEQDKGYGSKAIEALTEHLFKRLNIHRVEAQTYARNIPCIKSFEKAGYKLEAILKEAIYMEGGYNDIAVLKKLNEVIRNG